MFGPNVGGSPWGNAPPEIAKWLEANWGQGFKRPPAGPALPPAGGRPPLLSGRVPLGAARNIPSLVGWNPGGDPLNPRQMAPVAMKNPPPPGSLLAALFANKGPLPPPGFAGTMPGGVPPTGLPMGARPPTTPAPLTPGGGPPLTPQGLDPNYQALFGLNPTHHAMPAAQTNSTFGNVGKGWPFM